MSHRSVILVGDATDHGGSVLTGAPSHHYDGRAVARVGDTVSCPTHGNNAIVGGGSVQLDGQAMAVEGMATACGSHLIASQTMFNKVESRQTSDGRYDPPLWDRTSPIQPPYNPGQSPFPQPGNLPGGLSPAPPDNIPVPLPIGGNR